MNTRIVNNIKKVIGTDNIELLNKTAYRFIITHMGFIVHYNHNGFKGYYANTEDFKKALRSRIEYNKHYIKCSPEKTEVIETMRGIILLLEE